MRSICPVLLVFVATVCVVVAEEADTVDSLPDMTIVGSKQEVSTLPASGDYFDVDDIRLHSYDNIHQVLRKTSGVYVQEENGDGLLPNISLRGVDTHRSQKITIMEDGILTAPAPYSAPSAYYAPTMGRMSGLEVLKGSSQIKYGPHTTGGALNYLSTPVPLDQAGYLKFLYGSYDDTRAHAYYGGMKDTDSGRIGGLVEVYHREHSGFKTIKHSSGDIDDTGMAKTDSMVKLAWELDGDRKQRIELKLGYTDFEADETYLGLSEGDFDNDAYQRYYASHFDNFSGHHARSYLRHMIEISDETRLTTTAYANKFHRNWYKLNDIKDVAGLPAGTVSMSQALASGGPALAALKGENAGIWRVKANNRDYQLWGAQSTLGTAMEGMGADHSVEAGVRYHTDEVERFQWQNELTVDGQGNVTDISYGAKGAAGNRLQTAGAIAGFLQDEMAWDRFTLIPGVRVEHIENEVTDRNKTEGKQTGSDDVFAAGVGSKYAFSGQGLLFAGLYRGYSVPSPNDSISKDLEEETSLSGELGGRYQEEGLGCQVSCFYTKLEDLIVGGYVGTVSDTDAENAGNVNAYGLELKTEMDPGVRGDWGVKMPMWLAFTYTDATLDGDATSSDPESIFAGGEDGNEVPYIPECQVSVGIGIEAGRTSCELTAMYVDSTYSTANNSSEQVNPITGKPDARFGEIDSRLVVNASGRYAITEKCALFLNLHNLFDEEYLASRHPHGPRPGKPFTALAGVSMSF